jgi:uncharacterized protein with NAD-binding domain and iron-sulfur cluster
MSTAFGALAAGAVASALPTAAARAAGRGTVAIFGGGIAGLTAAHELADRGFEVTVYEKRSLGGKARSIPVPNSGTGGRLDLPAEHGFRIFSAYYQNVFDTMRRIPVNGNAEGVYGNLVTAPKSLMSQTMFTDWLYQPLNPNSLTDPNAIANFVASNIAIGAQVPANELALWAQKFVTYLTSGPQRRAGQWEGMSYYSYTKAAAMSAAYQKIMVKLHTTMTVAAKPTVASAHSINLVSEAIYWASMGKGTTAPLLQLLNGPTNARWIDPWVAHLTRLGVKFKVGSWLSSLSCANGAITGAQISDPAVNGGQPYRIDADYYIMALPSERAAQIVNAQPAISQADPQLAKLSLLVRDWMNGVMIYLKNVTPINNGHIAYVDSPWALSSVSQAQFWSGSFRSTYGDGVAADCLSIDLSDWNTPGILYGKTAKQCTPAQIFHEVLAQLRASLDNGAALLADSNIHSWFIDPGITAAGTPAVANEDPLLINTAGSWANRPPAVTAIPNLFLAGDYVRTSVNLATMEGANEAGRLAAKGVAAAAGVSPVTVTTLYQEPSMKYWQDQDDIRFMYKLPNMFDTIWTDWP